jgi:hypothetical protein
VKLDQEYTGLVRDKHWVVFSDGIRRFIILAHVLSGNTTGIFTPTKYTTEIVNEKLAVFGAVLLEEYKGNIQKEHRVSFNTGVNIKCKKTPPPQQSQHKELLLKRRELLPTMNLLGIYT